MDSQINRPAFLDQFFETTAQLYPDNIAIEYGKKHYTYSEVDRLANRLAHFLQEHEVAPEEKVAILLPRIPEVYIAMLGTLKAGGAYIPIDPEAPGERVNFIMHDSDAKMLITDDGMLERVASHLDQYPVFNIDHQMQELHRYSDSNPFVIHRESNNLCYIIYTSGSSGEPKGVLLEHRNVINYIIGAQEIYPVDYTHRVLQGFSVSFDASVEEIWVTFAAGATLVVGTFEIMRSGDRFASILNDLNITFLSCAPTLLSMVHEDIPNLKILIFGGEVCSTDIAHRWCKPGRLVYNTYGPTEAAVIATYSILEAAKPVSIGRPLLGYDIFVVNEQLEPVAEGEEGEILIGGPSVARGYLHRDDLTSQKFISTDRFDGSYRRYYRTGDLAKYASNGELFFMGRADAQVKVRGFRVELAEIEGLLLQFNGVQAAVVALDSATQQLAAYVVVDHNTEIDREVLADLLRLKLPYYMIPSTLDVIDQLPMTTSQKIDRKRLPVPHTPLSYSAKKEIIAPSTTLEKAMVTIMAKHFKRDNISMDDHFFNDLGGHSLLAALVVSEMREKAMFATMSVVDVYKFPVLSDLAKELEKKQQQPEQKTASKKERDIYVPSKMNYYTCVFFQGIAMIFLLLLFGIEWLGPFFVYSYYYQADNGVFHSMVTMLWMYFILMPVLSLFAIGFKWAVIGRIKPGKYKLWGSYYFRFWIVDKVINIAPINYFTGTSIMNVFLRALGAKIGKNVYINTSAISAFDLLRIGDNVSICTDTHLRGYNIADGFLYIGDISLEDDCFVGTRCNLSHNTKMERNSSIDDLTLVAEGTVIPANEQWSGSPAVKIGTNGKPEHQKLWSVRNSILFFISIFLIPLITMLAYFPGLVLITHLAYVSRGFHFLWSTIGVGVSFVVLLTVIIAILKWLMLGNIKEGKYPVNSIFYYKKWFFDQLMKLSLQVIGTLYTTLYLQTWFKMLGVKMGKRVEIATVEFISPDLLETGDECFLADSVSVGASHVRNGYITIAKARIGDRTFVGNSAVISPGTRLGSDVLVGVLSKMSQENLPAKDGSSWFGSPAVYLPKRDINQDFSIKQTYKPTKLLFILRYSIEFFRVTLPATFFIALAALITDVASYLQVTKSLGELFLLFPFMYLGAAILGTMAMAIFKWIVIGKYKPAKKPLWSHYVWRSELVTGVYENFLVLFFLNILTGTPFIKYPLRLLGCKIGKKACMFTTQITEFDLIKMGDNVAVNDNCTLQTHLFEDRVMKMSFVDIENNCSVGGMAVVLYDSKMEHDAILQPLSVLMKSETLPANTIFKGVPANPS
ncbi:Pls/PosA family non-ribosomal peptide synthetase [Microbacter margulisiae]|uniref:Non-ribosomal peptide synthetase-like protein n=1 Tax=Microbacter margulisiae TaxID=1350067 RepID=A0A7W5DPC5_9PORP|nr:Pls/PosA family non-ribosomal peptide synthetase [Microbacter margulisiae]MBB3186278.1 non-ribosomal peptide synthetase-like protein [Microbacter margulisiae]